MFHNLGQRICSFTPSKKQIQGHSVTKEIDELRRKRSTQSVCLKRFSEALSRSILQNIVENDYFSRLL